MEGKVRGKKDRKKYQPPRNVLHANVHSASVPAAGTTDWWPFCQLSFAIPGLSV